MGSPHDGVRRAVAVDRRDDELGRWRLWQRPVDARLSAWGAPIRGYAQRAVTPGRHVTPASALLPLVVPLGHRHRIEGVGGDVTEVGAFVAGSHEAVGAVEADGFVGLQVDLTPVAARRILGGDLAALVGRVVPLEAVLGRAGSALVARLGDEVTWRRRIDLLEEFLLDRWERGSDAGDTAARVWSALAAGETRVDALAERSGWSVRELRRRVVRDLGLPPKRLARVVRFHRAVTRLERDHQAPLARIAAQLGYADQAHMTREFRALGGTTPAALRRARAPV